MRIFLLGVLLYSMIQICSCVKVPVQFGTQYVDNENTEIIKIDTFNVDLSTVHVDSFVTSGSGVCFIGNYFDTAFGKIETNCFFELTPPAYSDIYSNTIYDSLSLILSLNKTYYGDSTKPLHIIVHQLAEEIAFRENESVFYNTQQVAKQPQPIGSTTQFIRPNQTDTIAIKLSDVVGKQLLKKLQDVNDEDVQSSDKFNAFFKGLSIGGSNLNNLIIGCKDSIIMRLHYRKKGLFLEEKTTDFTLTNRQHHFNYVGVNRANTSLEKLNSNNKEIASTTTNNMAYGYYIAGSMIKVKCNNVNNLLKSSNYNKLLRAQLVIKPVKKTFDSYYFLPKKLRLSQTNLLNEIGGSLTSLDASGNQVVQYGNFVEDKLLGENTYYSYDVTSYIQSRLQDAPENEKGLLLLADASLLTNQFQRYIIGNNKHKESKSVLEIYYLKVN